MAPAHKLKNMGIYGIWYGDPPKGCIYCMRGSKVVVFVSGLCGVECYYCPISFERRNPSAFYVDEERFTSFKEIMDEICMVKAEGASITGGEPLQTYYMVTNIVRMLKEVFGREFHIHLYTSGYGATKEAIRSLSRLGLDEIRFHIVNDDVLRLVEFAVKETDMDVGIEIPAILDFDWLWSIVIKANNVKASFININELEVSETNVDSILVRGYGIEDDGRSVKGSLDTAVKVVERAYGEGLSISIHVCPAKFKDLVQHRNRLRRKALTCALPEDRVNDDGTIRRTGSDILPTIDVCSSYIKI